MKIWDGIEKAPKSKALGPVAVRMQFQSNYGATVVIQTLFRLTESGSLSYLSKELASIYLFPNLAKYPFSRNINILLQM